MLCDVDQMVALADAKESGHLFLVAKGGEEGYTTCTLDDAPFGRKICLQHSHSICWDRYLV